MSSEDWLMVIGSPRVSVWAAESLTLASMRARAAPWLSGRPAKYAGSLRSKRYTPSLSVLPVVDAASNIATSTLEALTVMSARSTGLPKK
jgi:hypothetical protein